ncbi:spore coat protein B [Bacillus sp. DX4.1]|nr:spore coat protein B [Bacillus sp. DX4.1]MDM5186672.1 spore coat protein B [Bacillus sp. DX4.1]
MNMKKAIIAIVSTIFVAHTVKNRIQKQKEKETKNTLYYPYTLLTKK